MNNPKWLAGLMLGVVLGAGGATWPRQDLDAQRPAALTALDYAEIAQLINRYAYGIDTCSNNGYDYADVFTADGVFIDKNSDAGFKAGGRVLASGREALAALVGGGSRGCKTKLVWTDWSHLMLNPVSRRRRRGRRAGLSGADGHEGARQHRAARRLRRRLREDAGRLAHQAAHARARQGVARAGAADARPELTGLRPVPAGRRSAATASG